MNRFDRIAWILLLGLILFFGFNRHSKDSHLDYHSVLWADAGGYHVYLPWLFRNEEIVGLNDTDPQRAKEIRDMGVNVIDGVPRTKYPMGTALLKAPFYVVALLLFPDNGIYTAPFQYTSLVSGAFYGWLGLLVLFILLSRIGLSRLNAWLLVSATFLGTNFYYYTVDSPGFSHAYSFFSFALLMFTWSYFRVSLNARSAAAFLITLTILFLVRPLNVLWVLPALSIVDLAEGRSIRTWISALRVLLTPRAFWVIVAPVFLILVQLGGWWLMKGGLTLDTYENEGFTNVFSPKVLEVLFSTQNGMILYTPLWGVAILLLLLRIRSRIAQVSILLFVAALLTYASWWSWQLGCAFGYRGFVDLMPVFALSLGVLYPLRGSLRRTVFLSCLVVLSAFWNLKLTYSYDECWLAGDWEYAHFYNYLVVSKTR